MSQNNKQNDPNRKVELDQEVLKQIIVQQGQKLQLEEKKLRLEEKRIDHDAKLAEKQMMLQAELLKKKPGDQRMGAITTGAIIVVFMLVILGFIVWCLQMGKDDFVTKFLTVVTHGITLFVGYSIGKKVNKRDAQQGEPHSDNMPEAEIVDEP